MLTLNDVPLCVRACDAVRVHRQAHQRQQANWCRGDQCAAPQCGWRTRRLGCPPASQTPPSAAAHWMRRHRELFLLGSPSRPLPLRCRPPTSHHPPRALPRAALALRRGLSPPPPPSRVPPSLGSIMARKSLMAAAAALAVLAVGTVAAAKDEAVVSLTQKSFAETIAKEALVLVKFTVRFFFGLAGSGSRGGVGQAEGGAGEGGLQFSPRDWCGTAWWRSSQSAGGWSIHCRDSPAGWEREACVGNGELVRGASESWFLCPPSCGCLSL